MADEVDDEMEEVEVEFDERLETVAAKEVTFASAACPARIVASSTWKLSPYGHTISDPL